MTKVCGSTLLSPPSTAQNLLTGGPSLAACVVAGALLSAGLSAAGARAATPNIVANAAAVVSSVIFRMGFSCSGSRTRLPGAPRAAVLVLLLIVRFVLLDEALPLGRQVFLREDGLHRALVHAQPAVDAGVGVDVEHRLAGELRLVLRR